MATSVFGDVSTCEVSEKCFGAGRGAQEIIFEGRTRIREEGGFRRIAACRGLAVPQNITKEVFERE